MQYLLSISNLLCLQYIQHENMPHMNVIMVPIDKPFTGGTFDVRENL